MDAVAAHGAWLISHGLTKDEVTTVPVILREKTKAQSYSANELLSIHVHGSNESGPKDDTAYDAFIKLYRDNFDIKSAYDICLPANTQK